MAETGKPRLLVLTSTFPRWRDDPEPAFVHELARRLTDRFEITVLAPRAPGSRERETLDGLRVIRFAYISCAAMKTWPPTAAASSPACAPTG